MSVVYSQVLLLIWKRYREMAKNRLEIPRILASPIVFFVLMHLAYVTLPFLSKGGVEPLLVPIAFFPFVQRVVIQVMYEKSSRLQEAMKMAGLRESAYYLSYFITEGILIGFIVVFIASIISLGGLFNDASFGEILGFLFMFCLSVVPFCFFLCCFFDTPQTAGQGTLFVLLGSFAVYVIVFMTNERNISLYETQVICCLFPPLALQIAAGSFLKSHTGITLSHICGIMVADVFIFSVLTWYFSQVWPSKLGVRKPFYFFLQSSHWKSVTPSTTTTTAAGSSSGSSVGNAARKVSDSDDGKLDDEQHSADIFANNTDSDSSVERANESLLGKPTIVIQNLCKTFGSYTAVNNLSFKMYENQIFALLGHNGAGKSTTINMLTGLAAPDMSTSTDSNATIYGHSIYGALNQVRSSMGVCPQHDILFDNLSVREHILFFAQLKGSSYIEAEVEANELSTLFHLERRLDNTGEELSGGQKRKLSVAIAVCGGSKFIVLDEPTAGMDPLARRELWNLLASLRKGRTILMTSHYLDEADVLGDRIGIMTAGKIICLGSSQFLKRKYGPGYKLIIEFDSIASKANHLLDLTAFITRHIPTAVYHTEESLDATAVYILPFEHVGAYPILFTALDSSQQLSSLGVKSYGLSGASLEDVFIAVGAEDGHGPQHNKDETADTAAASKKEKLEIGSAQGYAPQFFNQVYGIAIRKLSYACNDFTTIPLLLLPMSAAIGGAAIYKLKLISSFAVINAIITNAIYTVGYLGIPGIFAEFIVRERNDKLRNILNVMGCNVKAYWLGTLIADFVLLLLPAAVLCISWGVADMKEYLAVQGLGVFFVLLFHIQLITFSYLVSYIFTNPKSCVSFTPTLLIALAVAPSFCFSIYNQIVVVFGKSAGAPSQVVGSVIYWFTDVLSPQGGLYCGLLAIGQDLSLLGVSNFPPYGASIAIMLIQITLLLYVVITIDERSIATLTPIYTDRILDETALDSDVLTEYHRVMLPDPEHGTSSISIDPLSIQRLRRIYAPVKVGADQVIAVQDISFAVKQGEVFGLLGANGAGKSTLLSMLTRLISPTSGDAFVTGQSILSSFRDVATSLGVVTQNNALWDRLTVKNHLILFARLRGVPEKVVTSLVEQVLEQLELKKHQHKLSMRLSGGMKRKLCVAIALIGDPKVVLLDEPSAGLDPVSARNLWTVISRSMSHRSVILTSHSMLEVEALCNRLGIMVQGQLRAIGSKQHLKNKFGSGYELTVKLFPPSSMLMEKVLDVATSFFVAQFPSAQVIYENGGLITYRLAAVEVRMGNLFALLEREKGRLYIEDYSIAQPTLEQVFIRIVTEVEGEIQAARQVIQDKDKPLDSIRKIGVDFSKTRAKCGCSDYCLKFFAVLSMLIFIITVAVGAVVGHSTPTGGAVLITIGIIFIIVEIVMVSLLCCFSCRNPVEEA